MYAITAAPCRSRQAGCASLCSSARVSSSQRLANAGLFALDTAAAMSGHSFSRLAASVQRSILSCMK